MKATITLDKEEIFKILQEKLKSEKDINANPGHMRAKVDHDGDFEGIEIYIDL